MSCIPVLRACVCTVSDPMYICGCSCIRDDWKGDKVDATGVDFNELEDGFREKVRVHVRTVFGVSESAKLSSNPLSPSALYPLSQIKLST